MKSWNTRSGELYVKGELQVAVPVNFYYKHMARARVNKGRLYAGVDVSMDRTNLVIVDDDGGSETSTRSGSRRRLERVAVDTELGALSV